MASVSAWQRLSDAIESVMAGAGCSREEAKTDICQAIADRTVNIQGKLGKHTTRPTTSKRIHEGRDFEIPAKIKPADFDWERSRPLKSWVVRREIFGFPGHWEVEWIELFRTDVMNVLCTPAERRAPAEHTSSKTGTKSASRSVLDGQEMPLGSDRRSTAGTLTPSAAGPGRRRGARPRKFEQTKEA